MSFPIIFFSFIRKIESKIILFILLGGIWCFSGTGFTTKSDELILCSILLL